MNKILTTLCLAGSLAFVGTANAAGTYQLGPQFGYSDVDVESLSLRGRGNLGDFDMKGAAVGLAARYTVPVGNDGMFVGLHTGFAREFADDSLTLISGPGSVSHGDSTLTGPGTISQEAAVEWSADIMPRIGYQFGDVSLSLAAGLSFVRGETEFLGVGVTTITSPDVSQSFSGRYSAKDTQWHTGWKIAPGIDYAVTENITLFGQAYYARYGSETYSGTISGSPVGVSIKMKPEARGLRAGVLFSF